MEPDLKRYELFGWDYEHHSPLTEREVDWYRSFLRKTGGPVLELACGTGRLLVSLARQGYEVVGIDLSTTMLHLARERIGRLPGEVQKRIALHNVNMSDFQLGRTFGLIFIADNSFRVLKTREQQLSCLKCVHRHLQPGGTFLVTERRFDPTKFNDNQRDVPWSEPMRHPTTGALVRRKIEMRVTKDRRSIRGVMFYQTVDTDGRETTEQCPFELPVMLKDDYISLFSEAGFSPRVFVDYDRREDDGKNPLLCFACDKLG